MEQFETVDLVDEKGKSVDKYGNGGQKETRQTWSSQMDFVMTTIGCAVGFGNIWRFPYLCYKNGGGAFFIPYLIAFFFVALPTFILEASLGQYTTSSSLHAWDVVPAFRGLGYAGQIILGYNNIYYIVILVWGVYYFYISLQSELPWASCGNPWNTDRCYVTGMPLNTTVCNNVTITNCSYTNATSVKRVDAVVEYWENGVLQMSRGIDEPGQIVPGLTIALLATWVVVFACVFRGVKWTGKLVYVTVTLPYLILTAIFIRGLTLEGSMSGIIYFLKPDLTRLADARVWIDGGTQILYSVGIGQSYVTAMGSFNKFNANIVRNCAIIMAANSLTSIFGGLAVFSVLGFMAHESGEPIATVVAGGPGLVFQTYPKAASQMPLSQLWSALFFLAIIFVGLDSVFVPIESFLTVIVDRFPKTFYGNARNRALLTAVYCFVCFLLGLPMVTQGGIYLFRLVDFYSISGLALLLICAVEVMAIGWVFGADRFCDVLELMTGRRILPWLKWCWKYIALVIVQGIFWFEIVAFKPLKFSDTYTYPGWSLALGVAFILSSTIWIPGVFLVTLVKAKGTVRQRLRQITTPILKPHQVHPNWKENGYRWFMKHSNDLH